MSLRDKYNKTNKELPKKETAAAELLSQKVVNTEIQKDVNTENNLKKATFNLNPLLHTKLKTRAAIEGRNMADIVTDALKIYFEQHK